MSDEQNAVKTEEETQETTTTEITEPTAIPCDLGKTPEIANDAPEAISCDLGGKDTTAETETEVTVEDGVTTTTTTTTTTTEKETATKGADESSKGSEEKAKSKDEGSSSKSGESSKSGSSSKSTKKKRKPPPVTVTTEKGQALHAHNVVRKMHGVHELEWDQNLANEAKAWAQKLAERNSSLKHPSPVIGYGQNLYKCKKSSTPAQPYQAVMLWYKSIMQYKFNLPGYSSATACATQMLWDETTHVGVAVAYREDKQTTYIVARYSPPGNDRFSESYIEHVKQPLKGLPPKMPKPEDLISTDANENLSNMGSLFDVLCHWCISDGEKPEEEISGVQPQQEDDSTTKNNPETTKDATKKDDDVKVDGDSATAKEDEKQEQNENKDEVDATKNPEQATTKDDGENKTEESATNEQKEETKS